MLAYIIKRLLVGCVVIALISMIVFAIFWYGPKSPARPICNQETSNRCTPERLARYEESMGYNNTITSEYIKYVNGVFTGRSLELSDDYCHAPCLGFSYRSRNLVWEELKQRLPATISIAGGGAALYLLLGIPIGIAAARRRGTLSDKLLVSSFLVLSSVHDLERLLGDLDLVGEVAGGHGVQAAAQVGQRAVAQLREAGDQARQRAGDRAGDQDGQPGGHDDREDAGDQDRALGRRDAGVGVGGHARHVALDLGLELGDRGLQLLVGRQHPLQVAVARPVAVLDLVDRLLARQRDGGADLAVERLESGLDPADQRGVVRVHLAELTDRAGGLGDPGADRLGDRVLGLEVAVEDVQVAADVGARAGGVVGDVAEELEAARPLGQVVGVIAEAGRAAVADERHRGAEEDDGGEAGAEAPSDAGVAEELGHGPVDRPRATNLSRKRLRPPGGGRNGQDGYRPGSG